MIKMKNKEIIEKIFDILEDDVGNKVYYVKGTCEMFYRIDLIEKALAEMNKELKEIEEEIEKNIEFIDGAGFVTREQLKQIFVKHKEEDLK